MRHSLIVVAKVLFVCVVFCYPVSSGAATATSFCNPGSVSIARDSIITPKYEHGQDSTGKLDSAQGAVNSENSGESALMYGAVFVSVLGIIAFAKLGTGLISWMLLLIVVPIILFCAIALAFSKKKRDRLISLILMTSWMFFGISQSNK